MKAQSSFFRQKNSKKGIALSTAMAISIVLVLLVAVLVSIASLNITTTQDTISQREAYVQAKSALAFVESYYSKHTDQVPGNGSGTTSGEGLVVFKTENISEGADFYVTKDDSGYLTGFNDTNVSDLKKNAKDTYVVVNNTASVLNLTAYCKYGGRRTTSGEVVTNAYKMSREFDFRSSSEVRPNAFTGNILYKPTGDTRYLRIHVRASGAFKAGGANQPFLYAWYTTVNNASGEAKGKSSIVNKMALDSNYATVSNGEWDGMRGPVQDCAMTYEGNSWYVTTMTFSSTENVNFVNAVVARPYAHRTGGSGEKYRDAQSWEFFGIPVPAANQTGEANGLDVYITLNQNSLKDYLDYYTHSGTQAHDEFTDAFEATPGSGREKINNFVLDCSKWYTVYTKKDTATVHYRKAGVYTNANEGKVADFTYEGYGWWRCTSNNFSDTFKTPRGQTYSFGSDYGRIVSQNKYGKEVVRELFVVESEDDTALFGTEADANAWLATEGEDALAGDYVTVNVKSNQQKVNEPIATSLTYKSIYVEETAPATPAGGEPTEPTAASNEELEVVKLAAADVEPSGDVIEYAIIGFPNNWGRPEDADDTFANSYEYINDSDIMTLSAGSTYSITYKDMEPGEYRFKVIQMLSHSGKIQDDYDGWKKSYGNGDADWVINVNTGSSNNDIVIEFTRTGTGGYISKGEAVDLDGGDPDPTPSSSYVIAGWMNGFGTSQNGTVMTTVNDYAYTDDLEQDGDVYVYDSSKHFDGTLKSGVTYKFKILRKLMSSGSIPDNHGWDSGNAWGGSGDYTDSHGNFVFRKENDADGNEISYTVKIIFNPSVPSIDIEYTTIGSSADATYYLVGDVTSSGSMNWDNQYETAEKFPMNLTESADGLPVYSITLDRIFEVGPTYKFKVVSSLSKLEEPDAEGRTINYEYSWGAPDGDMKTQGSDKAPFEITPGKRCKVTIKFTYNKESSSIVAITKDFSDEVIGNTSVGFYNNSLTNINNTSEKTVFTPWSQVFVTFEAEDNFGCVEIENKGTSQFIGKVPENTKYIYFSNMNPIEHHGEPGYERTVYIPAASFKGVTNAMFFPKSSTTDDEGVLWDVGDPEMYRLWTMKTTTKTGTVDMVYSNYNKSGGYSSTKNNYYDAPIVKVLNSLNPDAGYDPDGGGQKWAYSAYPYEDYNGARFKDNVRTVKFEGETYYYTNHSKWGYSYLIIEDTTGNKKGYLLESHLALMSGMENISASPMNNRGGGVFTSDYNYYNGEESKFNYAGYTPNWYTVKIPASSEVYIEKITGVTGSGDFFTNGTSDFFTPAKASDYYNQPIYIYGDGDDKECYTYDIDTGNVDTNKNDEATVYFEKPSDWGETWIHAYNAIGDAVDKKMETDNDNAEHYLKYTFPSGDYCFFVIYDHSDSANYKTATNVTKVHYFTGVEEDRAYQILIRGTDTNMSFYLPPRTAALNAYLDLDAAYAATLVPKGYEYNAKLNSYNPIGGNYEMGTLKGQVDAAKTYATGSGPWSSDGVADYTELATAAMEFSQAISDARIYISDSVPDSVKEAATDEHYTSANLYKEGSYRDDIVTYETRWVDALKTVYNNALSLYGASNDAQKNPQNYYDKAAAIYDWINKPEVIPNENAVQIIVNDQKGKDAAGNPSGLWGKSNIHIYNLEGSTWHEVGYDLYDTTQSAKGFYAYLFKLDETQPRYAIGKTAPTSASDGEELSKGARYTFQTATGELKIDTSVYTVNCSFNEITKDGTNNAYGQYRSLKKGEPFVVNFKNDTTVDGGSSDTKYTIYAGSYTISARNYNNFTTDVKKNSADWTGINLFTPEAKSFFTTPSRYGMTAATSYSPTWPAADVVINTDGNLDVMCETISSGTGTAELKAADNNSASFRYDGRAGQDTLVLNRSIVLEGGVVHVAVNNIKMNAGTEFTLKGKTIVFHTDTTLVLPSGKTETVPHGTYVFNESDESTYHAEINLSTTGTDDDWMNHFVLVDEVSSSLRGGNYVVNN